MFYFKIDSKFLQPISLVIKNPKLTIQTNKFILLVNGYIVDIFNYSFGYRINDGSIR